MSQRMITAVGVVAISLVGVVLSSDVWAKSFNGFMVQQTAQPISDRQIRTLLTDILAAAQARDSARIMSYLAPSAQVNLVLHSMAGEQRLSLNREQYQQYLQQGFEVIQDYTSTLSDIHVTIAPDGKTAIATYNLAETVTLKNPALTITSKTLSRVRFESINGKLVATQLDSRSTVVIPGATPRESSNPLHSF